MGVIVIAMSIYTFGWGFVDPFFSIYLKTFSENYVTVGWFHTLSMFVAFLVLIPLSGLLDRRQHIRIIQGARLGYVCVGVLYLLAGILHFTPLLLIALIVHGLMFPCVWTASSAQLSLLSPRKEIGLTFGLYTSSYNIAWIFGILFMFFLPINQPLNVMFVPLICFSFLSWLYLRRHTRASADWPRPHETLVTSLRNVVKKDHVFRRFWLDMRTFNSEALLVYGLYFFVYAINILGITFIPLYAASLGLGIGEIGLLVVVINAPFLLSFLSAEIGDRTERLRMCAVGLGVSAVAFLCLALWHTSVWQLYLFAFLFMAGYAILVPSLSAVVTLLTAKPYMGTSHVLTDMMTGLALMIFSPLIGWTIDAWGWPFLFVSASACCVVLMCVTLATKGVFKRRNIQYHQEHPRVIYDQYVI